MTPEILAFGEVLWDVIDGVPHIGGAPFNFAAHAVKCGKPSALISAIGDDELGVRTRTRIRELGVDDRFVATLAGCETGTVLVTLTDDGFPTYEIKRPVAWDEIPIPSDLTATPRALYFGTLAARSDVSAATLRKLWAAFPQTLTFFDVNLRQDFWSRELVAEGLAHTDILKVNDEEIVRLGFTAATLFERYPRLQTVVETRGKDGCAVTARDGTAFTRPAIDDGPVVDTVGAGDAFSAAFLSSVLDGASLADAAEAGNRRAGQVTARPGAIPEDL
jgi:fructokinase